MSAAFKCDRCKKFKGGMPKAKLTVARWNMFNMPSVNDLSMDLCVTCAGEINDHARRIGEFAPVEAANVD